MKSMLVLKLKEIFGKVKKKKLDSWSRLIVKLSLLILVELIIFKLKKMFCKVSQDPFLQRCFPICMTLKKLMMKFS